MPSSHDERVEILQQVDDRLELLKQALRDNYYESLALIHEIVRLEHSRFEYLEGVGGYGTVHPFPVLVEKLVA